MQKILIPLGLTLLLILAFLIVVSRQPVRFLSPSTKGTPSPSVNDGAAPVTKTPGKIEKIDEIKASQDLIDIEIDSAKSLLFVSSLDEDLIYAIDANTYQVAKTLNVVEPRFLVSEQNFLWATSKNFLIKINPQTGEVLEKISLPYSAYNFCLDTSKKRVYVLHLLGNAISIVDVETSAVLKVIFVGQRPTSVVQTKDYLYVTNFESGEISVISKENLSVVKAIESSGRPNQLLTDVNNNRLYVTDSLKSQVLVIDLNINEIVSSITVDEFPHGLVLSSDGRRLFVVGYLRNSITEINTDSLRVSQVWEAEGGFFSRHGFQHLLISGDNRYLFVTNVSDGTVVVFRVADSEV